MRLAGLNNSTLPSEVELLLNRTYNLSEDIKKLQVVDAVTEANENDFFLLIMACCIFCACLCAENNCSEGHNCSNAMRFRLSRGRLSA